MNERPDLYKPLSHIAWGYLLLHVNFNLGTLNVLPNWLGYLLILGALGPLSQLVPSTLLLRPLGRVLALWEGLLWVMAFLGREFTCYPVTLVVMVIGLYFHFQLLTDLAAIAQKFPPAEDAENAESKPLYQRLLRLRTLRTLLITLLALPLPGALLNWLPFSIGLVLVHLVVAIRIMAHLFSLRRVFAEEEGTPPGTEC